MRNDMFKVIVERPRQGGLNTPRPRPPGDCEDERQYESLRFRHQRHPKWLNENLRPLQRYLERQVGRPWDRVFSDLCSGIDRRNTVQQHIHQHLDDFVATKVGAVDGELYELGRYGGPRPLAQSGQRLYVHPDNGLLLFNQAGIRFMYEQRLGWYEKRRRRREPERQDVVTIDEWTQLRRIGGVWYEVELAPIPAIPARPGSEQKRRTLAYLPPFDVIARRPALSHACSACGRCDRDCGGRLYGRGDVYARSKRQLSRVELQRHWLKNETGADSQVAGEPGDRLPRRRNQYRGPARVGPRNKEH